MALRPVIGYQQFKSAVARKYENRARAGKASREADACEHRSGLVRMFIIYALIHAPGGGYCQRSVSMQSRYSEAR